MATSGRTLLQELQNSRPEQQSREQQNRSIQSAQVTVQNAGKVFKYLLAYRVLVCKIHCHAVRDLDDHLKRQHRTAAAERREIVSHFTHNERLPLAQVALPPPLEPPFDCLSTPKRVYICKEPECKELSISYNAIRKHYNKKHN